MTKTKVGSKILIYPIPIVLMGANVNERPNYNLLGNCGIISYNNPSILYVSSYEGHHTTQGVKENGTFSVNIPGVNQAIKADYCGIVSGKRIDKSKVFESFYGELETAPMAKECPINMECKVVKSINMHKMDVFFGEVIETYIHSDIDRSPKNPSIEEINPLIYSLDKKYYQIGKLNAEAYKIGKKYSQK